jgi:uncharacterized protein (DUF488 family)
MTSVMEFDLLTIGHSNLTAEHFLSLLENAGVTAIADVRSVPFSRRFPWFSGKTLAGRLAQAAIAYLPFGDALGGRPRDPRLYSHGIADYDAMAARPEFRAGLDRLIEQARGGRLCLMCAEREPLDCHRCLLVSRALAARGTRIGHILADGTIEPHAVTEDRLLTLTSRREPTGDLFDDRPARLVEAYRRRARAVAARAKP